MGRGKVELKRIENKINQQVTFSKRRNGLLKKAREISVLCDADVALIVFSTKGKLFEYSSDPCMETILERYERSQNQLTAPDLESQGSLNLEHKMLKNKLEVLQRNLRNYVGEDLDILSLKGLQSLENQIDASLKHIRSRKSQLMHETISELQKKDKALQDQNNLLQRKVRVKEHEQELARSTPGEQESRNLNVSSHALAQPLSSSNISEIYEGRGENGGEVQGTLHQIQASNSTMPQWMLHHVHG